MDPSSPDSPEVAQAAHPSRSALVPLAFGVSVCGPAAITAYLAFRSGGFFAGAPAIVAVVLGVALMLRLVLAENPFEGFGPTLVCASVALGCFAVWTLLSALWSHAPAQAMIEFDRALMYWLALVFFGSFGWTRERVVWAVRILAAAMVVVAIMALITRILPGIHSVPATIENNRLSYPLTYWNALGLFVSVAILLCAGLAGRSEEHPLAQGLAAAAIPILAVTLYYSFSRGAIGVLVIGTVAFVLIAARRDLIPAGLAVVPPTVVAVLLALGTHALSTEHYSDPAGVSEGKRLAWELIGCALAAGVLRFALRPLDRRLAAIEITPTARRRAWLTFIGVAVAVIVVGGVAVDAPHKISHGFEKFTESKPPTDPEELQNRLTNLNSNGRLQQWELALEVFGRHPLDGSGAGTFARIWAHDGNADYKVVNAHSLYLEMLAELGLPGLLFLAVAIVAVFVGLAARIRGPDRVLYAALFAASLAWAVHAGVDWDWEMPATGFFFFALGGLAIATVAGEESSWVPRAPQRFARVALGIGCLVLVVSPALVAISQGLLDTSVRKLQAGECEGASKDALDAIHVLSVRPEPYQVLGFCDARGGQDALAVQMLETAVARDKGEWESYYGLALVKAAAGQDPRPAARRAYELAPLEPLAREAVEMFRTPDPQKWRRRALRARLPIL
ncbi:MAG TPA: O-antigen ligase family protein [Solirubrobacterales bacterium]|nr:O-antigen ligase family protein [Solirubrobacterales bacterium]